MQEAAEPSESGMEPMSKVGFGVNIRWAGLDKTKLSRVKSVKILFITANSFYKYIPKMLENRRFHKKSVIKLHFWPVSKK